ncbi:hypothetical protein EEB15_33005 [Ramlibacter sp. WS9]|nr:hypothetical protein EEB15_33005 [Ramlibacter sp. WS9]
MTDEAWPTWSSRELDAFRASKQHFACAGIGALDANSAIDGPLYFFRETTREPVSVCGGACMMITRKAQKKMCQEQCPPPAWKAASCDEKFRDYRISLLPDIDEEKARREAFTGAGCVVREQQSMKCDLRVVNVERGWWIEVLYVGGQDSWTRSVFGPRSGVRFLFGNKGQYLETHAIP